MAAPSLETIVIGCFQPLDAASSDIIPGVVFITGMLFESELDREGWLPKG